MLKIPSVVTQAAALWRCRESHLEHFLFKGAAMENQEQQARELTDQEVEKIWRSVEGIIATGEDDPRYQQLCRLHGIELEGGAA
jgi:hypothetical protein